MRGTSPGSANPLADGHPEEWATEWGEDRWGVYAAFNVGDVKQRMRWIPPGTFWMGSPDRSQRGLARESGRDDDEGPRHLVRLSQGFWLGETPCTQALWKAVMGDNPSHFVSDNRPVEQVSWEDCQRFFEKLKGMDGGIECRFPTEAEWEYACRGGTETATWVGDLVIKGERNAPILDKIAWYGGNSGEGFELENGWNSSDWKEKQYPHTKAGTRPVGRKARNPFGLFDMLGNVYEWCADWYGNYDGAAVVDPSGPASGIGRVIRGGSWNDYARSVRAAYRSMGDPAGRHAYLGFRLARGRAPSPGAEP